MLAGAVRQSRRIAPHRLTHGTVPLDDMRVFAALAAARSFTHAASALGLPKQTVSRRIAELERRLDVSLVHRTTRRVSLTDAGVAYAERCNEITRLAEEANTAASEVREVPRGVLRVSADPVFGDAFLGPVLVAYARRHPGVRIDVVLTRRRVDLAEEGFDAAIRVGAVTDPTLTARPLGPARIRYCASRAYVRARGAPERAADLAAHDAVAVAPDGAPVRWPVGGALVEVSPRIRTTSFALAHAAVAAGLGVGLYPEFAAAPHLRRRALVPVLGPEPIDVGGIWLVHVAGRRTPARTRAFVDLVASELAGPRAGSGGPPAP